MNITITGADIILANCPIYNFEPVRFYFLVFLIFGFILGYFFNYLRGVKE